MTFRYVHAIDVPIPADLNRGRGVGPADALPR